MEQQLLNTVHHLLSCPETTTTSPSLLPYSLSRSLITNPSTSDETLTSLLHSLTLNPSLHALSLLSSLASLWPHLRYLISLSLPSLPPRCLALALSLSPDLSQTLTEAYLVSLSLLPSVSVRQTILRNAERFQIRPSLLLTVFLGFTKDPYPLVRCAALDGLISVCKRIDVQDRSMIDGCYCRSVELLFDTEDHVRRSAVYAVSEWGQIIVAASEDECKVHWSDALLVQLCSMVRDMSVKVRIAAFDCLAKITVVSEDILLQTLSKKVLSITKEKKYPGQFSLKQFEIPASSAAGAFVHGLEDELYEVRRSACFSLRTLVVLSAGFSAGALNLLVDVLNDDSLAVRLQALDTMHRMAVSGHLELQEVHTHMFLGTLVDTSALVRSAARKVLRITKLRNLAMFKLAVDSLIQNLEMYPQDEADVFSVVFNIGRDHGKFVVSIIKEVSPEIEPSSGGFNSAKTAARLVLAISAPLSHLKERQLHSIPPVLFSYAVTMLGRISRALTDVMDQTSLLAYLTHCSGSTAVSCSEIANEDSTVLPTTEDDLPNDFYSNISSPVALGLDCQGSSENFIKQLSELSKVSSLQVDNQLEVQDEAGIYIKLIFSRIEDLWQLAKVGCANEVLEALRNWKEELANYTSARDIVFSLHYLGVVKLLVKVWMHFMASVKFYSKRMGELEVNLEKLGRRLKEMRYRFIGLTREEEIHILELILLTCTLRLSNMDLCGHESALKNIYSTMSHVDFLYKDGSLELSTFLIELKKALNEIEVSAEGDDAHNPFLFSKLLEFFTLKQFPFYGGLKHVKAEVQVKDNGAPLPFVPGLPVGIPLQITLHNNSPRSRLWVKIALQQDLKEFVFLDPSVLGGLAGTSGEFSFTAPFYRTPKAKLITLSVCIGMECLSEDVRCSGGGCRRGPKRDLVYLCKEKEVGLIFGQ